MTDGEAIDKYEKYLDGRGLLDNPVEVFDNKMTWRQAIADMREGSTGFTRGLLKSIKTTLEDGGDLGHDITSFIIVRPGYTDAVVPGSIEGICTRCGRKAWLSPHNAMTVERTGYTVICYLCAMKQADTHKKASSITSEQILDLFLKDEEQELAKLKEGK
jgi:hypothetical protein